MADTIEKFAKKFIKNGGLQYKTETDIRKNFGNVYIDNFLAKGNIVEAYQAKVIEQVKNFLMDKEIKLPTGTKTLIKTLDQAYPKKTNGHVVFFDTETTGVSDKDDVLQLAGIHFNKKNQPQQFNYLLKSNKWDFSKLAQNTQNTLQKYKNKKLTDEQKEQIAFLQNRPLADTYRIIEAYEKEQARLSKSKGPESKRHILDLDNTQDRKTILEVLGITNDEQAPLFIGQNIQFDKKKMGKYFFGKEGEKIAQAEMLDLQKLYLTSMMPLLTNQSLSRTSRGTLFYKTNLATIMKQLGLKADSSMAHIALEDIQNTINSIYKILDKAHSDGINLMDLLSASNEIDINQWKYKKKNKKGNNKDQLFNLYLEKLEGKQNELAKQIKKAYSSEIKNNNILEIEKNIKQVKQVIASNINSGNGGNNNNSNKKHSIKVKSSSVRHTQFVKKVDEAMSEFEKSIKQNKKMQEIFDGSYLKKRLAPIRATKTDPQQKALDKFIENSNKHSLKKILDEGNKNLQRLGLRLIPSFTKGQNNYFKVRVAKMGKNKEGEIGYYDNSKNAKDFDIKIPLGVHHIDKYMTGTAGATNALVFKRDLTSNKIYINSMMEESLQNLIDSIANMAGSSYFTDRFNSGVHSERKELAKVLQQKVTDSMENTASLQVLQDNTNEVLDDQYKANDDPNTQYIRASAISIRGLAKDVVEYFRTNKFIPFDDGELDDEIIQAVESGMEVYSAPYLNEEERKKNIKAWQENNSNPIVKRIIESKYWNDTLAPELNELSKIGLISGPLSNNQYQHGYRSLANHTYAMGGSFNPLSNRSYVQARNVGKAISKKNAKYKGALVLTSAQIMDGQKFGIGKKVQGNLADSLYAYGLVDTKKIQESQEDIIKKVIKKNPKLHKYQGLLYSGFGDGGAFIRENLVKQGDMDYWQNQNLRTAIKSKERAKEVKTYLEQFVNNKINWMNSKNKQKKTARHIAKDLIKQYHIKPGDQINNIKYQNEEFSAIINHKIKTQGAFKLLGTGFKNTVQVIPDELYDEIAKAGGLSPELAAESQFLIANTEISDKLIEREVSGLINNFLLTQKNNKNIQDYWNKLFSKDSPWQNYIENTGVGFKANEQILANNIQGKRPETLRELFKILPEQIYGKNHPYKELFDSQGNFIGWNTGPRLLYAPANRIYDFDSNTKLKYNPRIEGQLTYNLEWLKQQGLEGDDLTNLQQYFANIHKLNPISSYHKDSQYRNEEWLNAERNRLKTLIAHSFSPDKYNKNFFNTLDPRPDDQNIFTIDAEDPKWQQVGNDLPIDFKDMQDGLIPVETIEKSRIGKILLEYSKLKNKVPYFSFGKGTSYAGSFSYDNNTNYVSTGNKIELPLAHIISELYDKNNIVQHGKKQFFRVLSPELLLVNSLINSGIRIAQSKNDKRKQQRINKIAYEYLGDTWNSIQSKEGHIFDEYYRFEIPNTIMKLSTAATDTQFNEKLLDFEKDINKNKIIKPEDISRIQDIVETSEFYNPQDLKDLLLQQNNNTYATSLNKILQARVRDLYTDKAANKIIKNQNIRKVEKILKQNERLADAIVKAQTIGPKATGLKKDKRWYDFGESAMSLRFPILTENMPFIRAFASSDVSKGSKRIGRLLENIYNGDEDGDKTFSWILGYDPTLLGSQDIDKRINGMKKATKNAQKYYTEYLKSMKSYQEARKRIEGVKEGDVTLDIKTVKSLDNTSAQILADIKSKRDFMFTGQLDNVREAFKTIQSIYKKGMYSDEIDEAHIGGVVANALTEQFSQNLISAKHTIKRLGKKNLKDVTEQEIGQYLTEIADIAYDMRTPEFWKETLNNSNKGLIARGKAIGALNENGLFADRLNTMILQKVLNIKDEDKRNQILQILNKKWTPGNAPKMKDGIIDWSDVNTKEGLYFTDEGIVNLLGKFATSMKNTDWKQLAKKGIIMPNSRTPFSPQGNTIWDIVAAIVTQPGGVMGKKANFIYRAGIPVQNFNVQDLDSAGIENLFNVIENNNIIRKIRDSNVAFGTETIDFFDFVEQNAGKRYTELLPEEKSKWLSKYYNKNRPALEKIEEIRKEFVMPAPIANLAPNTYNSLGNIGRTSTTLTRWLHGLMPNSHYGPGIDFTAFEQALNQAALEGSNLVSKNIYSQKELDKFFPKYIATYRGTYIHALQDTLGKINKIGSESSNWKNITSEEDLERFFELLDKGYTGNEHEFTSQDQFNDFLAIRKESNRTLQELVQDIGKKYGHLEIKTVDQLRTFIDKSLQSPDRKIRNEGIEMRKELQGSTLSASRKVLSTILNAFAGPGFANQQLQEFANMAQQITKPLYTFIDDNVKNIIASESTLPITNVDEQGNLIGTDVIAHPDAIVKGKDGRIYIVDYKTGKNYRGASNIAQISTEANTLNNLHNWMKNVGWGNTTDPNELRRQYEELKGLSENNIDNWEKLENEAEIDFIKRKQSAKNLWRYNTLNPMNENLFNTLATNNIGGARIFASYKNAKGEITPAEISVALDNLSQVVKIINEAAKTGGVLNEEKMNTLQSLATVSSAPGAGNFGKWDPKAGTEYAQAIQQFTMYEKELTKLKHDFNTTPAWMKRQREQITINIEEVSDYINDLKDTITALDEAVDPAVKGKALEKYAIQMDRFKRSLNLQKGGARNVWETLGNSFRNMLYYFTQMGLAYNILGKLKQSIAKVVQAAQQLDGAMTNLRIVTGDSKQEVKTLIGDYANLAKRLSATTSEVATAANEWLRQGYDVSQVNKLITSSLYLSKLGMTDTATATKVLTSTLKGFKLEAQDAISVVDKLTTLDMSAAVSASEIGQGLAQFAATGSLAGLNVDQASALVATIADVSQRSGTEVGNALRTIISRYSNVKAGAFNKLNIEGESDDTSAKLNDVEKVLNKIGISLRNSNLEIRDFDEVLDDLAAKWNNLDNVSKRAVSSAFAGVRQQEYFNVLMENYDKYKQFTDIAASSAGNAEKKYLSYTEQLEAAQKRLQSAWESLALNADINEWLINIKNVITFVVKNLPIILRYVTRLVAATQGFKLAKLFMSPRFSLDNIVSKFKGLFPGAHDTKIKDYSRQITDNQTFKRLLSNIDKNVQVLSKKKTTTENTKTTNIGLNNLFKRKNLRAPLAAQYNNWGQAKGRIFNLQKNYNKTMLPIDVNYSDTSFNFSKDSPLNLSYLSSSPSILSFSGEKIKEASPFEAGYLWGASSNSDADFVNNIYYKKPRKPRTSTGTNRKALKKFRTLAKPLGAAAVGVTSALTADTTQVDLLNTGDTETKSTALRAGAKIATGALSAGGYLIGGPLGAMVGGVLGDILNKHLLPFFEKWFDNDSYQLKLLNKSSKEASEKLQTLKSIETDISSLRNLSQNIALTGEQYQEAADLFDSIISKLLQSNEKGSSPGFDLWQKMFGDTSIIDLREQYLSGTAADRKRIASQMQSVLGVEEARLFANSQGLELGKINMNTRDYALAAEGATSLSSTGYLTKDMIKYFAQNRKDWQTKTKIWYTGPYTGPQEEIVGFENVSARDLLSGYKEYRDYLLAQQESQGATEANTTELNKTQDAINQLNSNIAKQNLIYSQINAQYAKAAVISTTYKDTALSNLNNLQISSLGKDEIVKLVAEQWASEGGAIGHSIFDGLDEKGNKIINQEAYKEIISSLKMDNRIWGIISGQTYTLKELFDPNSDVSKNLEQQQQLLSSFAAAMGMSIDELKNHLDELGSLTLADVLKTPAETRETVGQLNTLFSSMASSTGLTGENLEVILEKFPQLIKYLGDTSAMFSGLNQEMDALINVYGTNIFNNLLDNQSYFDEFRKEIQSTDVDLYKTLVNSTGNVFGNASSFRDIMEMILGDPKAYGISTEDQKKLKERFEKAFDITIKNPIDTARIEKYMTSQSKWYESQINNLKEQKEALEQINNQREYENKLIEAKIKLENAQKEKRRVYRAGVGWVYESDQAAVKEAQKELDEITNQQKISEMQEQIAQLESEKQAIDTLPSEMEYENLRKAYEQWAGDLEEHNKTQAGILQEIARAYTSIQSINIGEKTAEYEETWKKNSKTVLEGDAEKGIKGGNELYQTYQEKNAAYQAALKREDDRSSAEFKKLEKERFAALSEYQKWANDTENQKYITEEWYNEHTGSKDALKEKSYDEDKKAIRLVVGPDGKTYRIKPNPINAGHSAFNDLQEAAKANKLEYYEVKEDLETGDFKADASTRRTLTNTDLDTNYGGQFGNWVQTHDKMIVQSTTGKNDKSGIVYNNQLYELQQAAKGLLSAKGGPALINELGTEAIVTPQGTLTALPSRTGVVPADITSNLWQLGEMAPSLLRILGANITPDTLGKSMLASNTTDESFNIHTLTMNVSADGSFDVDKFVDSIKARIALTRNQK